MTARQRQRGLLDLRDLSAWCASKSIAFDMVDDESKLLTCHVLLPGPDETPYAGGNFTVCIQLPATFPISSPSIAFKTAIWHPNVEKRSGSVCLDVINDRWTPVTRLVAVVETYLPELLRNPNRDDPLNATAAAMMSSNMREYEDWVRTHTRKHAMAETELELPDIHGTFDFSHLDKEYASDSEE